MFRGLSPNGGCAWHVQFIQPAAPDDGKCVMLYGPDGEIVGPLTMEMAEAWMDHFDNARYQQELRERSAAPT